MREEDRIRYRRKKRKRQIHRRIAITTGCLLLIFCAIFFLKKSKKSRVAFFEQTRTERSASNEAWTKYEIGNPVKQVARPELDVQLLTINEHSRPGIATDGVKGVVVHYTANPGSTAQNNRDYFESLKDSGDNDVSSNFIVGLDGEIVQCVPTNEIAYASNSRNNDTVSIECCHPDETGKFNDATYDSLVELVAFLCGKFDLTMDQVIRHYDVTGKNCPKYFVENESAWNAFKEDVAKYIEKNGY